MASDLPSVGSRLSHLGSLGTIRFVGPVVGTPGIWLGVEWDDSKRGKHDGVKDGQRYFSCLVPNSGSFIRPTASIAYGVTFLTALHGKYIDIPHGDASLEKVILGSSGGAIEVEAVGLDRIRRNLSRLERLREVSLDNQLISKADLPGEVNRTCSGIRGLDLSQNLMPSWETIVDIIYELNHLRGLCLNRNRLNIPPDFRPKSAAFRHLEDLQINATLTTWHEFRLLLAHMPVLRSVEMGYNRLHALVSYDSQQAMWSKNDSLQTVNLDGNELADFLDLSSAMNGLYSLQRLILTSNCVSCVAAPSKCQELRHEHQEAQLSPLRPLKHLALASNRLKAWHDIDSLQRWCPVLDSLTLAHNPLSEDPLHVSCARAFTIARIPSLNSLDGAAISPRERTDSELLYLSHISKQHYASDAERQLAHPQWQFLTSKHGIPDAPHAHDPQDTLSNRLINIKIYHCAEPPPPTPDLLKTYLEQCQSELTLRVLSTISFRTLGMKVMKTLKITKSRQNSIRVWMLLPDGSAAEVGEDYGGRDLAYWGVEEGTQFVLVDNS